VVKHRDTILVRSAGNYVGQPITPNPDSKKRVKSAPINFDSAETWITKEDGIVAQKVLAGIAYNLTEVVDDENNQPILDEREVPVATALVLEVLGIFQNLDGRHYTHSTPTQRVESHSLGSAANVTIQAGFPIQGREAV
jgi:hypothetical protein